MKKILILIAVVVVILIAFLVFNREGPTETRIIEDTAVITLFEGTEGRTKDALVSIPFLASLSNIKVSVSLDIDGDGTYSDSENIISDVPIRAQANWKSGFYFETPQNIEEVTNAQVTIDEQIFDIGISIQTQDVGSLLELETITNPEEAMKGIGIAYAQTDTEISNDDVPDINQKPGECAPTAAANGLIDLVRENGTKDQQLGDPNDLINDLKEHMKWTRANGVLPDDFVAGKNSWAAENDLPIKTEKVGDKDGISTVEDIKEALENGDAVELRIKFGNAQGRAVGGHMVTVTGIHQDGDEVHLDINDPATVDSGTESVQVSGNQFTNYGPWDGFTVLSWGFVQSWTGPEPTPISTGSVGEPIPVTNVTGENSVAAPEFRLEPQEMNFTEIGKLTPEDLRDLGALKISVLQYGGQSFPFPFEQFGPIVVNFEECPIGHFHGPGFTLDLKTASDPDPGECGWRDNTALIEVTGEQMIQWFHNKP